MKQLFVDTLTNIYDRQTFKKFSLEFFNKLNLAENKIEVDEHSRQHIDSIAFLGNFEDKEGKKLHVLEVKLKTDSKLEQARTMQRNVVAKYLKDHWLDGAFVAFYTGSSPSWRLSFVKIDYKFDENGKTKEELTPAKRYSFFVGKDEPTHTAQTQLFPIYSDTVNNPTLAQIEEAFGIEKVTKDFFEQYRKLFEVVTGELKTNHTFINEAERYNIDTDNFAKKLLGQIVFLYFLQKKGWLGVPKGKAWGEGDKNFLSGLYKKCIQESQNFYNDYLEKLFYDTLNNPRRNEVDPSYSKYFNSRIPFLNGGLFEAPYNWNNSLIYLDNKIFGNVFDIFDLYNFTVKEDEPLEKEVAVDPEMLGKVFENLLAENLRKGKGTYYTPREIVNYMCEESLVNYLATETGLSSDDIKKQYFPAYNKLGDEKYVARDVSISQRVIESLKSIKIVDPACGSGAFLVGMLQQVTHLRLELEQRLRLLGVLTATGSTEYLIKKETIQNCIYGVDIDPGAIEIAKLRLWLSLVVDYELEEIEPLPNLDYKLKVGNSLIEKFDANFLAKGQYNEKNELIDEVKKLKDSYFNSSDSKKKSELRLRINEHIRLLINYENDKEKEKIWARIMGRKNQLKMFALGEEQQSLGDIESDVKKLDQFIDVKETDHFEWHLNFNEVFERGGFDIIIANPPYIKEDVNKKAFNGTRDMECYQGKMDIWYLFGCRSIDLLKKQGFMCFIATNNWVSNDGASKFRNKIVNQARIINYVDFGNFKVFDAGVQTMVFLLQKNATESVYDVQYRCLKNNDVASDIISNLLSSDSEIDNNQIVRYKIRFEREEYKDQYITFLPPKVANLISKIKRKGTTKLLDDEVFSGIDVMQDFLNKQHLEKLGAEFEARQGVFVLSEEEFRQHNWNEDELQILKPYYTTKEINRYKADSRNRYWIIYSSPEINKKIAKYPNIKSHLDKFKKIITSVNKPYGLHRTREEKIFLGEKILSIRKCSHPSFSYVYYPCYVSRAFLIIKTDRINIKYLQGLLNSKIVEFWLRYKGKLQGNQFQVDKKPLLSIPILIPGEKVIAKIISLASKAEKNIGSENKLEMENKINLMLYKLYSLTPEEIAIIEG